jgi:hypothetical protein
MRALRRIATPASVAVAISGCTYAFDDYLPQKTDAGLSTNQDVTPDTEPVDSAVIEVADDTRDEDTVVDTYVTDTYVPDTLVADTVTTDAPVDACICVKFMGTKCREWSPPDCGE